MRWAIAWIWNFPNKYHMKIFALDYLLSRAAFDVRPDGVLGGNFVGKLCIWSVVLGCAPRHALSTHSFPSLWIHIFYIGTCDLSTPFRVFAVQHRRKIGRCRMNNGMVTLIDAVSNAVLNHHSVWTILSNNHMWNFSPPNGIYNVVTNDCVACKTIKKNE